MDTGTAILLGIGIRVVLGVVVGAICAAVANSRGRNATGWFFIGFGSGFIGTVCLGWIPILIVCVIPDLNQERHRHDYYERENRRLREQVRQERIKHESFREHTMTRLDAHDQHMGIDTRSLNAQIGPGQAGPAGLLDAGAAPTASLPAGSQSGYDNSQLAPNHLSDSAAGPFTSQEIAGVQQSVGGVDASSSSAGMSGRHWHYEFNGESVGPISERQLLDMIRAGQISGSTLLWTEELGDWKAACDIRALRNHLPADL